MNFTTPGSLDFQFQKAKATLFDAFKQSGMSDLAAQANVDNAVLTQGYLRLEQLLNNSATYFNFPILNNQTGQGQPIRPNEVRLNQQDAFFCTSIAIYLATASATAAAFPLLTYPNPVSFPTGAASLYAFYNGRASISVNNSVIVPQYPMSNFLLVNQTQLTAATNSPISQFDPQQVSLWQPSVNFIGTKNTQIVISLNGNIATIDANTVAVIVAQGILAQNVTLMS